MKQVWYCAGVMKPRGATDHYRQTPEYTLMGLMGNWASGIGTPAVPLRGSLRRARASGCRSSKPTARATSGRARSSRGSDGGHWSFGNARCATPRESALALNDSLEIRREMR